MESTRNMKEQIKQAFREMDTPPEVRAEFKRIANLLWATQNVTVNFPDGRQFKLTEHDGKVAWREVHG